MSADQGPNAETPDPDSGHGGEIAQESASRDPLDPWAALPRFSGSQLRLEQRINRWARDHALSSWLDWLEPRIGTRVEIGPPEVLRRASGLRRPGLIVQFRWPAMGTRLAIGLEIPLAHSIVDRLLGYDRPLSESRLQLTPVEWGVWTYLVVRVLDAHLPGPPASSVERDRAGTLAARRLGCPARPRQPGPVRLDRPGSDRDPAMARPRGSDGGSRAGLASRVGCSISCPRSGPARREGRAPGGRRPPAIGPPSGVPRPPPWRCPAASAGSGPEGSCPWPARGSRARRRARPGRSSWRAT